MTKPIEELKKLEKEFTSLTGNDINGNDMVVHKSIFIAENGLAYRQIALDLAADYLAFAEEMAESLGEWHPVLEITVGDKIKALRSITDPGRRQNHGF